MDYFKTNARYEPLDAVNLIFRGGDDVDDLLDKVLDVLDQNGWGGGLESPLFLQARDDWIGKQDESRSTFPLHLPLVPRSHVRFWKDDDRVVAAAHEDGLFRAKSFDAARDKVSDIFQNEPGWRVNPTPEAGTKIREPSNDGNAIVIETV